MPPDWTVRPYTSGDEASAAKLFEDIFDSPMTVEQHGWKFDRSSWPYDVANIWVAESQGRIVGQFAGVPLRFKLGNEIVHIVQGCDVMTAPEFRRQGVLSAVGRAALDSWKSAGVPFLIGLHNERWGSRNAYLDLRVQFQAASLWIPLRPDRLLARRFNPPSFLVPTLAAAAMPWHAVRWFGRIGTQDIAVEPVPHITPVFDTLWASLAAHFEALVVRDRAWIAHRYFAAPNNPYRVLLARRGGQATGYLVYRLRTADTRITASVADLVTAPEDGRTGIALINALLTTLHNTGAESVHVPITTRPSWLRRFRRMGFLRKRIGYRLVVIPLAHATPPRALCDPNRWFAMAGDFDIL